MLKNYGMKICALATLSMLLCGCTKPYEKIKNKSWFGQLHRMEDDKELSDVFLKMTDDSLFLYSNAIFGAQNDTLVIQKVNEQDSTLLALSEYGNRFHFKVYHRPLKEQHNLVFMGSDYYITLLEDTHVLSDSLALNFYHNQEVPREAYKYLSGVYMGELKSDNDYADAILSQMGGMKMKLVFLNDFKVRCVFKMPFFDMFGGLANTKQTTSAYSYVGNKILIPGVGKSSLFEIADYGNTLILYSKTGEAGLVLHKAQ